MSAFQELFDLSGRVAIVTGGGRGIGKAIATGLSAFGADVVIADTGEADEVVSEIEGNNRKAAFYKVDISQKEQVGFLVEKTIQDFGRIDILVNNAGISHRAPATHFEVEDFQRVLSVNLVGVFLCSQSAGRKMIETGSKGSIINISSIAGVVGVPHTIAYSASKGGVTQLTKALAIEWAPYGIRVNGIAPCPVETELARKTFAKKPEIYEELLRQIPLGRAGQPEDIVGAAVFLASGASAMVTGHILSVDGGWIAQ